MRWTSRLRLLLVFALYAAVAGGQQWLGGAYRADLAGQPDESAHYVTGLLIREYFVEGFPVPPLEFAREYYLHYPKVAFGVWPPGFHLLEAGWMLVFGTSKAPLIALMALLTAGLMTLLYAESRRHFPESWSLGAGLFLGLLPLTQDCTSTLTPDVALAVAVFGSVMLLRDYLESPGRRTALRCSLVVAAALLLKANALALLLVVPLALWSRRRLFFTRSFWGGAALVALVAGPWQILSLSLVEERHQLMSGLANAAPQFRHYLWTLITNAGFGVTPLAVAGLGLWAWSRRARPWGAFWTVCAALLAGYLAFHSVMPPPARSRYLLAVLPVVLLFAMAGAREISRAFRRLPLSQDTIGAVLCLLALAPSARAYYVARKPDYHLSVPLGELMRDGNQRLKTILVASGATGEGVVVSEFAWREPEPTRFVLRASKVLYTTTWKGSDFRMFDPDTATMASFLRGTGVDLLLVDERPGALPPEFAARLRELVSDERYGWELDRRYPASFTSYCPAGSPAAGANDGGGLSPAARKRILGTIAAVNRDRRGHAASIPWNLSGTIPVDSLADSLLE